MDIERAGDVEQVVAALDARLRAAADPDRASTEKDYRRGEGDWDRFAELADRMLEEREFFVRKAIGWVLRETAKRRPELVADWLEPRAQRAAGLTVREAIKPLSAHDRDRILTARSAG